LANNSLEISPELCDWLAKLSEKWQKPLVVTEVIQPLWSGYGVLCRITAHTSTYVAKYIAPPEFMSHPKGWNSHSAQQRKLASYGVEKNFYRFYANKTDQFCRVPTCLDIMELEDKQLLLLEDLQMSGFTQTKTQINSFRELKPVIRWLAYFHMRFMGVNHQHLWQKGCYWHLDTRQEEYEAMVDGKLKQLGPVIDQGLSHARYQTLIHGDAKLANFCFTADGDAVAAVDFQYTGTGVGVRDLMLLLSSSLSQQQLQAESKTCVDFYFQQLAAAGTYYGLDIDMSLLE